MSKFSTFITTGARQVDTAAGGIEAVVLSITSRAAGWIACVPTILLTARSCEVIFDLTPPEAIASAVALELIGQSTTSTWLRAREWNRNKRLTDPSANAWLALALTVSYFAIDFILIAALQVPKARAEPIYYAALLFPLAQVISTVITAERAAQFGREAVAAENSVKRRDARKSRAQVPADNGHKQSSLPVSDSGGRSYAEFERALSDGELDVNAMTGQQVAQWAGKSAATGRRWKRRVSGNGNHTEVR